MNKKRMILVGATTLAGLALLAPLATAYQEPAYEIVGRDGKFELRRYEPYLVVETLVEGDFDQASRQAFQRLFRYISGKKRQQIRPDDPKVAMTVPVTMTRRGEATSMTFMLPADYTLETAPPPADPAVQLRREPGGLVAALPYRGRSNQQLFLEHAAEIEAWLAKAGLEPEGDPFFAGYDPPYKPGFLRRNEVLVPVSQQPRQ